MNALAVTRALILCLCLLLTACGGSSLDSDTDTPSPSVLVNAGADLEVNEQTTVQLSASAVGEADPLSYSWQVSPAITLIQPSTAAPDISFQAPAVSQSQVYTFVLTVTDGNGNQGSDQLDVTVQPVNAAPNAIISLLSPEGTSLDAVPAGVGVVLSAASSNDADAPNPTLPITAWQWQQTAGPAVIDGISVNGETLAFTSPVQEDNSELTFTLTVTDAESAQDTATVDLTILGERNTLPTVNAGVDHSVFSGESIILTGEAESSVTSALPLSVQWLNDSDLAPVIDDAGSLQTYAIAPDVSTTQRIIFTLEVTDNFGNIVNDSLTVNVRPLPLSPVNDTGVIQQADETTVSTLHRPQFPGQDGQRGADIISTNGVLDKAGRGELGFDFTRLDELGDQVDDTSLDWRCVRDNVTGLVWEVKTSDGGLHSAEHTYSWRQTVNAGGFVGPASVPEASCDTSLEFCNTDQYVLEVNEQGLCNFNDWRMPRYDELLSIVHFGRTTSPLVDVEYLPNTAAGTLSPLWYWTTQSSVDGAASSALNAWVIDFSNGNDNFINKASVAHIRLVRGGR